MNPRSLAKYEARAKIMKARAHPPRPLIVDELAQHVERCICEQTDFVASQRELIG